MHHPASIKLVRNTNGFRERPQKNFVPVDPPQWLLKELKNFRMPPENKHALLPCAQAFLMKGVGEGARDNCHFTYAKHCRYSGMTEDETLGMLERANQRCIPPLQERTLKEKVHSAYHGKGYGYSSLGCDDPAWKEFCEGKDSCPVFNKNDWPDPEPVKIEMLPVMELPPEIIPEPIRPWLEDISNRMQCPIDFVFAGAMVILGSVIGAGCGIRPKQKDDWLVIPNLWGGVIGPPSTLKTPALTEVMKPLIKLELNAKLIFDIYNKEYEADVECFKARLEALRSDMNKAAKGKAKDGPDMGELKHRYIELKEPETRTRRRYKTNDATIEKMSELLNENPRGILLFRDELVGLLASWDKEGRESDRAFYLEAWNGSGHFTTDRIGRGTIDTSNLCVSILGGIQPSKLLGYLYQATSDFKNDGLLQRMQVLVYPDERKDWILVDKEPNTEAWNRASKIFDELSYIDFEHWKAMLSEGESIPYFHFTEEAQQVFYDWITRLQKDKLTRDENPALLEHLAKYRSLMPALALIFHLVEVVDGITRRGQVSKKAAETAAACCDWLESHARRIYGMAGNITIRAAAELSRKIQKAEIHDGFTARELYRKGWHLLGEKKIAQDACLELVDAGWLREEARGKSIVYRINPKIYQKGK